MEQGVLDAPVRVFLHTPYVLSSGAGSSDEATPSSHEATVLDCIVSRVLPETQHLVLTQVVDAMNPQRAPPRKRPVILASGQIKNLQLHPPPMTRDASNSSTASSTPHTTNGPASALNILKQYRAEQQQQQQHQHQQHHVNSTTSVATPNLTPIASQVLSLFASPSAVNAASRETPRISPRSYTPHQDPAIQQVFHDSSSAAPPPPPRSALPFDNTASPMALPSLLSPTLPSASRSHSFVDDAEPQADKVVAGPAPTFNAQPQQNGKIKGSTRKQSVPDFQQPKMAKGSAKKRPKWLAPTTPLPDFDFEAGLAQFNKQDIFDQLREEDDVDPSDRLVSSNLNRKLRHDENILTDATSMTTIHPIHAPSVATFSSSASSPPHRSVSPRQPLAKQHSVEDEVENLMNMLQGQLSPTAVQELQAHDSVYDMDDYSEAQTAEEDMRTESELSAPFSRPVIEAGRYHPTFKARPHASSFSSKPVLYKVLQHDGQPAMSVKSISNDKALQMLDRYVEIGYHPAALIELAGARMAECDKKKTEPHLLVVSGRHFKGACGLACARHLATKGCQITVSFLEFEQISATQGRDHWDDVIDQQLVLLNMLQIRVLDSVHALTTNARAAKLPHFDVVVDALWPLASSAREARFSPAAIAALHFLVSQQAPMLSIEDPSDGVAPHGIIAVLAPRTSWSTLVASSPPKFTAIVDLGLSLLKDVSGLNPPPLFTKSWMVDVVRKGTS